MHVTYQDLIILLLAVVAGGIIGIEREFRDKAAGFRTLIFICLGSTLFSLFSSRLPGMGDHFRIASNIVSGVGFLGAGVILRERGRVTGLTTAATIWLAAALGMGLGAGQFALVGVTVFIAVIVLWVFPAFEHWVDHLREECTYLVVYKNLPSGEANRMLAVEETIMHTGLRLFESKITRSSDQMIGEWKTSGSIKAHYAFRQILLDDPEILEFKY
jgi:putative Mg2+ transporter-C (MgtC) family protein